MPTYSPAPAEAIRMVESVMEKWHGELHEVGVTVKVLMVGPTTNENGDSQGPPLKIKGFPCSAVIKATSTRDRAAGLPDVLLQIDEDRWKEYSDGQREALIDHELMHLEVKRDKDEQVVFDDQDRPKLVSRPHDKEVGWFESVVRRHKENAIEWAQFDSVWQSCKQLELPFTDALG